MKVVLIIVLVVCLLIVIWGMWRNSMEVDVDFADKVVAKYHYSDKKVDVEIKDTQDIYELKSMMKGISFWENPSCGFTVDISVTFSSGDKSITLCPAVYDRCSFLRINESSKYIRIKKEQRERLEEILGKYGVELITSD